MSVKASVSISNEPGLYARGLVKEGRFASVSAVVQQGLNLLQRQDEVEAVEFQALKVLLADRASGSAKSADAFKGDVESMLMEKRRQVGLDG